MVDHSRDNYSRFIAATERVKDALGRQYNQQFTGVGKAVQYALEHDHRVVRHHQRTLKLLVDLRNTIQHHAVRGGVPVADPREDAVEALEKIADQVERHPPIGHFAHPPKVLAVSDSLRSAAETVVECDLSQLPVYDGDRYVGMFTTNAMARWLGASIGVHDGVLLAENVTVEDVLEYVEPHEKPLFVKPADGAFVACDKLSRTGLNVPLALLVTTDGTARGVLQGIVTRFDVPNILRQVSVSLS